MFIGILTGAAAGACTASADAPADASAPTGLMSGEHRKPANTLGGAFLKSRLVDGPHTTQGAGGHLALGRGGAPSACTGTASAGRGLHLSAPCTFSV